MHVFRHWPLAAVALLLNACSWISVPETASSALASEAARGALQAWQFNGRVNSDSARASLRWRQQGEQFDLLLRGPFGFGGVRIIGDPAQVEINDGQERLVSRQPVEDIFQRTGLMVPLGALRYWALGLPAPGPPVQLERNLAGYISRLDQAGWEIHLDEYQAREGLVFPHRIELQQGEQRLIIAVSQWKLP